MFDCFRLVIIFELDKILKEKRKIITNVLFFPTLVSLESFDNKS